MNNLDIKKWNASRERMRPCIDAVFWQELGIGGAENKKYVDWILDRIIRPEFEEILNIETVENWCVMRLDDNGNEFIVSDNHTFNEATKIVHEYESKGHKQTYWIKRR
jgi:hypothetical protein